MPRSVIIEVTFKCTLHALILLYVLTYMICVVDVQV